MSNVVVKMKMTPSQSGALYMKSIALEDKIKSLNSKIESIQEEVNRDLDDEMDMADALYNISCVLGGA